jgi:hypothetical protein
LTIFKTHKASSNSQGRSSDTPVAFVALPIPRDDDEDGNPDNEGDRMDGFDDSSSV